MIEETNVDNGSEKPFINTFDLWTATFLFFCYSMCFWTDYQWNFARNRDKPFSFGAYSNEIITLQNKFTFPLYLILFSSGDFIPFWSLFILYRQCMHEWIDFSDTLKNMTQYSS